MGPGGPEPRYLQRGPTVQRAHPILRHTFSIHQTAVRHEGILALKSNNSLLVTLIGEAPQSSLGLCAGDVGIQHFPLLCSAVAEATCRLVAG